MFFFNFLFQYTSSARATREQGLHREKQWVKALQSKNPTQLPLEDVLDNLADDMFKKHAKKDENGKKVDCLDTAQVLEALHDSGLFCLLHVAKGLAEILDACFFVVVFVWISFRVW